MSKRAERPVVRRGYRRGRDRFYANAIAICLLVAAMLGPATRSWGTEGATTYYLAGANSPLSGVLAPEGVYFDSTTYFYSGKFKADRTTDIGGVQAVGVSTDAWVNYATLLWVTPLDVMGGTFALSAVIPFGEPSVRAGVVLNGPLIQQEIGHPIGLFARDSTFNIGDPVVVGSIGWQSGNWHWKASAGVNIPGGAYQLGELSNVALNRWIGDFTFAATYLDPTLGLDLSAAAGFIINGINPATHYKSGDEFHIEAAISKSLTKDLSVGAIVSYYQQVSGDSGSGATVGPFKGRATAAGGTIGYAFQVGDLPVSGRIKLLREIDVKNRPQGTVGWVQLSVPLWTAPPTPAATR